MRGPSRWEGSASRQGGCGPGPWNLPPFCRSAGSDPALADSELARRLRHNRQQSLQRLEQVVSRYARLQDQGEEEEWRRRKRGEPASPSSSGAAGKEVGGLGGGGRLSVLAVLLRLSSLRATCMALLHGAPLRRTESLSTRLLVGPKRHLIGDQLLGAVGSGTSARRPPGRSVDLGVPTLSSRKASAWRGIL